MIISSAILWFLISFFEFMADKNPVPKAATIRNCLFLCSVLLTGHALTNWLLATKPPSLSFLGVMSISLVTATSTLWMTYRSVLHSNIIYISCIPTATTLLVLGLFPEAGRVTLATDSLSSLHILASMLAWATIVIACMQACMFSFLNKGLKQKNLTRKPYPALVSVEQHLTITLAIAWSSLTLSLISGFITVESLLAQKMLHKAFFSLIAWGIFFRLLWLRFTEGWRGDKLVRRTLLGTLTLLTGYLGTWLVLHMLQP